MRFKQYEWKIGTTQGTFINWLNATIPTTEKIIHMHVRDHATGDQFYGLNVHAAEVIVITENQTEY